VAEDNPAHHACAAAGFSSGLIGLPDRLDLPVP